MNADFGGSRLGNALVTVVRGIDNGVARGRAGVGWGPTDGRGACWHPVIRASRTGCWVELVPNFRHSLPLSWRCGERGSERRPGLSSEVHPPLPATQRTVRLLLGHVYGLARSRCPSLSQDPATGVVGRLHCVEPDVFSSMAASPGAGPRPTPRTSCNFRLSRNRTCDSGISELGDVGRPADELQRLLPVW